MENLGGPSKNPPKRGMGEASSSGVGDLLFNPLSTKTNPIGVEMHTVSSESRVAGLQELRDRLVDEITQLRGFVDEVRMRNSEPKHRLNKAVHQLGSLIKGKWQRNTTEKEWAQGIMERRAVIEAINEGDEGPATEFLASEIGEAIGMVRVAFLTRKNSGGLTLIDRAQRDINLLRKIDPAQADGLQQELDKKTGNSFSKI